MKTGKDAKTREYRKDEKLEKNMREERKTRGGTTKNKIIIINKKQRQPRGRLESEIKRIQREGGGAAKGELGS